MLRNIIYLFYKYYDKGSTKAIAYESALLALLTIFMLNIFSCIVLFDLFNQIPIGADDPRWLKYLKFFIGFVLPGFLLLRYIFKEEEILKVEMEKSKMKKGYVALIGYIILSLIILFIAVKVKK